MIKLKSASCIFLILLLYLPNASLAKVAVKVFSYNESMSESNYSKPRIFIQNTGSETIDNFTYRYFFSTEDGQVPMIEPLYLTDKEQIMLVQYGNGYYVQYTITNANLTPGGLMPHGAGNCIGIHYNNWSSWNKSNDFSDNMSSSFVENQNISVYVAGTRIYGNEHDGGSGETGYAWREVWTNISGTSTDNIPITTIPNFCGPISNLDEPKQYANNFGSRIRGYITAPLSGCYTFWIASDDDSKFYLSSDEKPANKGTNPIAWITNGYTSSYNYEWNKYSSQKSLVKNLIAGKKYYFEILHKDSDQDDNCSVGWLKPGQSGSVPSEIVPSSVLSPYFPTEAPAAPTNLTATASSSRIDLSWTDASNNECCFTIQMKFGSGEFKNIAIVGANQTSYQVTGLIPETNYMFRIRACNTYGNSDYNDTIQVTTYAVVVGGATRELWKGCPGTNVADIPIDTPPFDIRQIDSLESSQQAGDYFGRRIRGYIIPPSNGGYTFWIASDDCSQLWLSTDDQVSSKVLIASVLGYTSYREWNKYSSQKSNVITLNAGVRYYFEILHKEGNQNDNLSVGWLKPGQSGSVPSQIVPKSVLSPFIIPSLPNAPGGLAATPVSATQVDLTWTDNSNNEDGFRIERALYGQPFMEIGTAPANSSVYHDGGLKANTQYEYRIRAYNDQGNSDYSSTINITTLEPSIPVPNKMELSSFAIYSTVKTELRDHSHFTGGGAVGSNTSVDIFPEAVIHGNAVSGGNIILKSQAVVHGNIHAAGEVTIESGASVNGTVEEGVTIATIEIPVKSAIHEGTENVYVNRGENRILSPGYYKKCIVATGGTLTLSAGLYTFCSLFIQPDADIVLNVAYSDMIDIEIGGDLEFSDRSKVTFADKGYIPLIHFYTNDSNTVRIGCDVQFNGILIAPHGNVAMYSRAQCSGAIYAKTITIEPDAVIMSEMTDPEKDSDGDHIANILEVVMNTDPFDPTSYHPIAIPSKAKIDNSSDVTITYDFSVFFPDYPSATELQVTFPAGALTLPYIPLLIYLSNSPAAGDTFSVNGHDRIGRFINFRSENNLNSGMDFEMQIPVAQSLTSLEKKAYQFTGVDWQLAATTVSDEDKSIGIIINKLEPLVVGSESRINNATIYFDNGCVFRSSSQTQLQYLINIIDETSIAQSITLKVEYTDLSTSIANIKTDDLIIGATGNYQSFSKTGKFIFSNPVQIDKIVLVTTCTDATVKNYEQICGTNFTIGTGKTMQIQARTNVANIASSSSSVGKELIAVYYPKDITFESSNFGDGRIVVDYTHGGTQPYTYEYFLKDHQGSTRMVINDQGSITEAVMYQPYGTMLDVPGGVVSPIPVREKYTGKEFDFDGAINGAPGINLLYFGARSYDPDIGVWTSADPAEQYWNLYSYCGGNPVVLVDPDGQWAASLIFGLIELTVNYLVRSITSGDWDPRSNNTFSTTTFSAGYSYGTGPGSPEGVYIGINDGRVYPGWSERTDNGSSTTITLRNNYNVDLGLQLLIDNKGVNEYIKDFYIKSYEPLLVAEDGVLDATGMPLSLSALNGGIDLLRSTRFDADGNIQLNRRGLLGSFGVPIAGGIVGAGTATTLGVTGLYLGAPAIGSEVIVPAAKLAYRYRAGIQAAGEALLPTPYPIAKSFPELGAATLLEVGSWMYDNWGNSSGYIAPATKFFAPDATRIVKQK